MVLVLIMIFTLLKKKHILSIDFSISNVSVCKTPQSSIVAAGLDIPWCLNWEDYLCSINYLEQEIEEKFNSYSIHGCLSPCRRTRYGITRLINVHIIFSVQYIHTY